MTNGIETTTTLEIDWHAFGEHLASVNSDDQAAFLAGFASKIHGLGAVGAAYQIQFIADSVHGHTLWLIDELNERLLG